MGGASQEEGSDKMTEKLQQLVQENATSQEEVNNMMKGLTGSLTYWEISQNFRTCISGCHSGISGYTRLFLCMA